MIGLKKYKAKILILMRKMDVPSSVVDEVIISFDDICGEFDIGETYDGIVEQLGTPNEFLTYYIENRDLYDDPNDLLASINSVSYIDYIIRISTWKLPNNTVFRNLTYYLLIIMMSINSSFIFSGYESEKTYSGFFRLFLAILSMLIIFTSIMYVSVKRRRTSLKFIIRQIIMVVILNLIFMIYFSERYTMIITYKFYSPFIIIISLIIVMFASILAPLIVIDMYYFSITVFGIQFILLTYFIGIAIYSIAIYLSRFLLKKHQGLKSQLDNVNDNIKGNLKNIERKDFPRLRYLKNRSLTASRFAPQFSKGIKIFYSIIVMLIILSIILDLLNSYLIGAGILLMSYIVYEIFSGLTGWHFTSRKDANRLRYVFRLLNYIGLISSFIYTDILGNFDESFSTIFMRMYYLVYLEIIIALRENIPGLIPLNTFDSKYTISHIISMWSKIVFVIILYSMVSLNISYFTMLPLILYVFAIQIGILKNKVFINRNQILLFGISPVLSIVSNNVDLLYTKSSLIENSISSFIDIISLIIFSLALFNYFVSMKKIWRHDSDCIKDTKLEYMSLASMLNDISDKFNKLDKYNTISIITRRVKLYYLAFIPIIMLLIGMIFEYPYSDILNLFPYDYFNLSYFHLYGGMLIPAGSVVIFLMVIEINPSKNASSIRSKFNQYKIILLIISVIILLSSAFFVNQAIYYDYNSGFSESKYINYNESFGDYILDAYQPSIYGETSNSTVLYNLIQSFNKNYDSYVFDGISSYLPVLTMQAGIRMSDWVGTFPIVLINESIYRNFILNAKNSSKEDIFNFKNKFYLADSITYDKLRKEDNLVYFDNQKETEISKDDFAILDQSLRIGPFYRGVIYTTYSMLNSLHIDISPEFTFDMLYNDNDLNRMDYRFNILYNTVNHDISVEKEDIILNSFSKLLDYSPSDIDYYVREMSLDENYYFESYFDSLYYNNKKFTQILFFISIIIIDLIIGWILSAMMLNDEKNKIDRRRLINLNFSLVLFNSTFILAGSVIGLLFANISGIFVPRTLMLRSDINYKLILMISAMQLLIQLTSQIVYSLKNNRNKIDI